MLGTTDSGIPHCSAMGIICAYVRLVVINRVLQHFVELHPSNRHLYSQGLSKLAYLLANGMVTKIFIFSSSSFCVIDDKSVN